MNGETKYTDKTYESAERAMHGIAPTESTAYGRLGRFFAAGVACQIALLGFVGALPAYTLMAGTPVTLKTVPVDPWDMFRGSYVALRYDISSLPVEKTYEAGQKLYVVLKKGEPYWTVKSVGESMVSLGKDEVVMRATVDYMNARTAAVHYGIEKYFVPNEEAKRLERTRPNVDVRVDQFGNSVISSLLAQ